MMKTNSTQQDAFSLTGKFIKQLKNEFSFLRFFLRMLTTHGGAPSLTLSLSNVAIRVNLPKKEEIRVKPDG